MDKLHYENLYKFFVSLGVVLISLPIAALIFLANSTINLISKTEFENLSEYSIRNLEQQEYIITFVVKILPIISVIFFVVGILLIVFGLIKWSHLQKYFDSKIAAETKIKELEAAQMSNSELLKKQIQEIEETPVDIPSAQTEPSHLRNRLLKYFEIEDRFFKYGIPIPVRRRHLYKRNIKIGNNSYDAIGVSLKTNTDLIYEVKYWTHAPSIELLHQTFYKLYQAGLNYKKIENREYHCILAIIAPKEKLSILMKRVDSFLQKQSEVTYDDIEIQWIEEETLVHHE